MLLSTPEQIEQYHSSGIWGDKRLDQIFSAHAMERPEDLALIDDQELHSVTGRRPQCLSYGRAWKRVIGLCNFLIGIGMKSDSVVAMMLPPSVDAAILTLAASRMGLILAPLPLTSGETEIREALESIGAKAIVCCSHYENEPVAERARNVAAEMFSIRFVFGIGEFAPEGLIELQSVLDDEESVGEDETDIDMAQPSPEAVLAIHWTSAGSLAPRAVGRSHNQFLSAARHVREQSELDAGDCVMIVHHMTSLIGFAAGMVGAMDAGARIQFHHFKTLSAFCDGLGEYGVHHLFLPGGLWENLHKQLSMPVREILKSVTLVWNRSHGAAIDFKENETAARLIDLTNFCEIGLFCQIRRQPGEIGSVPLGQIKVRYSETAVWMETFLYGMEEARARGVEGILGGELCLKGAMIPHCAFPIAGAVDGEDLRATSDGMIHTEIGCHLVTEEHGDERALFRPLGDLSDVVTLGGLTERGSDLDKLYKSCEGVVDAAAFTAPGQNGAPAQLMAALVVDDKDGAKDRFYHSLKQRQIASTRWPRDVIFVEAIPRQTDGRVKRESLLAASQVAEVA